MLCFIIPWYSTAGLGTWWREPACRRSALKEFHVAHALSPCVQIASGSETISKMLPACITRTEREVEGSRVVTLNKAAVIVRCKLPCIEAFCTSWCSSLNQTLHPTSRLTAKSADFFFRRRRDQFNMLSRTLQGLHYLSTTQQMTSSFTALIQNTTSWGKCNKFDPQKFEFKKINNT